MKVIVESIGPENHAGSRIAVETSAPISSKWLRRENRYLTFRCDSRKTFSHFCQPWSLREEIGQPRGIACELRPPVNPSHRVGRHRTPVVLVIMRKEFRFVGSHVDVDRAFRLARFASEAQVERLANMFVLPASGQRIPLEHFEKKSCASTRRMHLLMRDHIARTHRAACGLAAFADSDTAGHRVRETVLV